MTVPQTITVRYFAAASDIAGREEETIAIPPGATVGLLKTVLTELHGEPMARVLATGSLLIGGVLAREDETPVGPEVDVLPPFSGG